MGRVWIKKNDVTVCSERYETPLLCFVIIVN